MADQCVAAATAEMMQVVQTALSERFWLGSNSDDDDRADAEPMPLGDESPGSEPGSDRVGPDAERSPGGESPSPASPPPATRARADAD